MSDDRDIENIRIMIFLIEKGCDYCDLFVQSDEYKSLLNFEKYIDDKIQFTLDLRFVNENGLDQKRFSNEIARKSNYQKPGRILENVTKNYALAKGHKITHFPAIVLEIKKRNRSSRFKTIQGLKLAQKNSIEKTLVFNFLKYIQSYLKGGIVYPDQVEAFTHNRYKYVMQTRPKLIKMNS